MSNCLIFAIDRWWKRGGYFIVRRSHHWWGWHFIWSPDLKHFESYTPLFGPRDTSSPPFLFHGYVKTAQDTPRGAR